MTVMCFEMFHTERLTPVFNIGLIAYYFFSERKTTLRLMLDLRCEGDG